MKRVVTVLLTLLLASVGLGVLGAPVAFAGASGERVSKRLYRAIEELPKAPEVRRGYDRSKFRLWVDANGDCQDSRDEVLAAESLVAVSGCDIQTGRWRSYYDGVTTTDSGSFDIDHLVPLAEAWDSGARRWNAATRQRYANDLRDSRTLVAVTASSNRSKSDRDVAEWMPGQGRCRYVREWVAVKVRWQLTVNRPEKRALRRYASGCANRRITVTLARVGTQSGPGTGTGLDPQFATCADAIAAGYGPYVQGQDPEYDWYTDGDSDGVVCE
ncbi:excalibur calcium-binding domain-containing protein [Nocardioides mesophilus]|uniref:DUF1524 domain-containing protein n=1 Tax=Nocardioides mesophilus TaxID=433659 RepID=A0A7G9R7W6_9ACTN|nr:DUF1524 domain-containing protein [Nocardioides mesophilus]QNN51691.1 DUF1524 domain-containing protein [Nocardioides mesophilus]